MMLPREKDRAFHAGMKKDGLGICPNMRKQPGQGEFRMFQNCGSMKCGAIRRYHHSEYFDKFSNIRKVVKIMGLEAYKGVYVYAQQVDNELSGIAFELLGKAKDLAKDLSLIHI